MGIAFSEEFTLETEPRIPLRLRHSVDKHLDYARSVSVVRRHEAEGRQTTVNRFKLTETDTPRPAETTEEVAQAVCNVMQAYALGLEANNHVEEIAEGLTFLVRFAYFGNNRQRNFRWTWKIDRRDGDEVEEDEIISLTNPELQEDSHIYLHAVIRQMADSNERTQLAKERVENRLLEMAERTQKPMELIDRQAQYSHGILMQGMQAMVSALELRYDHDKAQAAEAARAERWDRMLSTMVSTVGPAAKIGFQQLVTYLGNKANGKAQRVPRAAEFHQQAQHQEPKPQPRSEDDDSSQDAEPEDPFYEVVAAFGESLSPSQRKMLRKKLTPKTLDLFDDLLEGGNETEIRQRYHALYKHLGGDLSKLLDVAGELEENQQALAMALIKMLTDDETGAESSDGNEAE